MPLVSSGPELIAHRGASRERLENTLRAFVLALERGADAVELDAHCSSDGVVVVHHDAVASGRHIARTSWEQLAQVELAGGERIPRLEDVLVAIGERATVYVELKGDAIEGTVLDVLRQAGRKYAVHSFDHAAVGRAMVAAPKVPRGILLDRGIDGAARQLKEAVRRVKARDAWPHHSLVDRAFMDVAADLDVRVIAWTVNTQKDAIRLRDLGVDGLCTDDVRLLTNL